MKHNYLINGLDLKKVLLESDEIGLKYFKQDVIEVILAELKHLVSSSVSL